MNVLWFRNSPRESSNVQDTHGFKTNEDSRARRTPCLTRTLGLGETRKWDCINSDHLLELLTWSSVCWHLGFLTCIIFSQFDVFKALFWGLFSSVISLTLQPKNLQDQKTKRAFFSNFLWCFFSQIVMNCLVRALIYLGRSGVPIFCIESFWPSVQTFLPSILKLHCSASDRTRFIDARTFLQGCRNNSEMFRDFILIKVDTIF